MKLFINNMIEKTATDILQWKYEPPYDFYNNELTDEAMEEILDGTYYEVTDEKMEIIRFLCIGKSAQVPIGHQYGAYKNDFVDMGLGMKPTLTGKRNGYTFCSFIIKYINENYPDTPLRLTVAKFNQRAIHLYEKLGFIKKNEFSTHTAEFFTMIKN